MTVRILVVDDEPDLELLIRQRFRRQIREGEYDFLFARDGEEALRTIQEDHDIDIVLTDINMPVMDGLTLLMKLNELNLILKAVIVSAYGDMENIRTAMNRGAFDFITKPIDFNDLEITIQKTLRLIRELKRAIQEHRQLLAIQRELDIANHIQQSVLPQKFPPFPERKELDIHAQMIPAREVGGDFYDFFFVDEERLAFVIGDVSGKGIPAALFMMVTRTLIKSQAMEGGEPGHCLYVVNNHLTMNNAEEMFVTVFYGILNTRTGVLQYGNGGHNPPYLIRCKGGVAPLEKCGNLALGIFDNRPYIIKTVSLEPGDAVFLFTDGITEAENKGREFYGDARLQQALERFRCASARETIQGVVEDVRGFSQGAPQSDDITALCVRYLGKDEG